MLSQFAIPVLQAPMVGASSPALAAAVSAAGGLGAVACGAMTPQAIRGMVAEVRALTDRPFGINLFVLRKEPVDSAAIAKAVERLKPWRTRYSLPEQKLPAEWYADFDAQLQTVIDLRPAMASFTFGCLTADEIARLRSAKIYVVGTATTVDEAKQWREVGADAVCLQGQEAGGHRGSFTPEAQISPVPLMTLLTETKKVVSLPLVAAGGIMDGKGIREVLDAGAVAAQLGTAFLLCPEAVTNAPWRKVLKSSTGDVTRLTRVFSGRYARGIENAFMRDMADIEKDLPAYPVQNVLTGDLRATCAKAGYSDCLSLWAGTNFAKAREMPAGDLLQLLWKEAQAG